MMELLMMQSGVALKAPHHICRGFHNITAKLSDQEKHQSLCSVHSSCTCMRLCAGVRMCMCTQTSLYMSVLPCV